MKPSNEKYSILFGTLTLILFASTPYLVDLIEPAKSIGQIIGENAKDLLDGLNGEKQITTNSKREVWINILTILAFISLVISIIFSISSLQNSNKMWYTIPGILLSSIGLGIYLSYLSIGLIGIILIALLVVAFIVFIAIF